MKTLFAAALVSIAALMLVEGCTKKSGQTLWIYTSIYPHVVEDLTAKVAAKFPGVDIKWYQGGSENVAAKVNSELLSGKTQADLIISSDLFWYEDLRAKNQFLAYDSPAAAKVPAQFKDPGHFWSASRVPVMVVAYNSDVYTASDAPKGFADLALPKFKDKVAMPSPLESGTTFTAVALIQRKLGWDYFSKLRANGVISAGGNSAVMARIESKERPVGMVLLENILTARKRNPKIVAVYPNEGAVTIPSPIAITANTAQPELAKQVYDYFFSKEAQEALTKGDMYSIFTDIAPPAGAEPWMKVLAASMPWNLNVIQEVRAQREPIKQQFSKLMLE
ncbi:MAG: extracellular solute-binding protein [Deltaproteobacteria bacterium]|nr:extracellular solute-binding protein [Deltaproteobacteria bacterium]